MIQNISWETSSCLASKKNPIVLLSTKFHYHVHKIQLLVPTLSQINPVQISPILFI
jgi:hypothetical protein